MATATAGSSSTTSHERGEGWAEKKGNRGAATRGRKRRSTVPRRVALSNPERIDRNTIEWSEETSLSKEEIAAEPRSAAWRQARQRQESRVCIWKRKADHFKQLNEWHGNQEENSSGNFGVPEGKIPRDSTERREEKGSGLCHEQRAPRCKMPYFPTKRTCSVSFTSQFFLKVSSG